MTPKTPARRKGREGAAARGVFVAFDGLDGSGQSTQAERLAAWLSRQGCSQHLTKEPTSGPAGALIRLALTGRLRGRSSPSGTPSGAAPGGGGLDERTLALLFAADRADHVAQDVTPLLDRGVNVVCDRYLLSSYAYQGVHVSLDWFREVNRFFPVPDVTVFVDVPPSVCMERLERTRVHLEKNERLDELERVYAEMHRQAHRMRELGADVVVVRGDEGPPEFVHERIVEALGDVRFAKANAT